MAPFKVLKWLIVCITFQVLCISHPTVNTRDVAAFVPFRRGLGCGDATPPLHVLVHRLMGRSMGLGYEHPVRSRV